MSAEDDDSPVAALTAAVDDLPAMRLTSLPVRDLPGLAAAVKTQLRRLPVFDHALIAEMDRRDVAREVGARSTAAVLVEALPVTPGEARARVKIAESLGPVSAWAGRRCRRRVGPADRAEFKGTRAKQIDNLLAVLYGLVALAIVFVTLGIINTLALSWSSAVARSACCGPSGRFGARCAARST